MKPFTIAELRGAHMHNSSGSLTWTRAAVLTLCDPSDHETGTSFPCTGHPHASLLADCWCWGNFRKHVHFPPKKVLAFSKIKCLAPGHFYFEPSLSPELWLWVFTYHIYFSIDCKCQGNDLWFLFWSTIQNAKGEVCFQMTFWGPQKEHTERESTLTRLASVYRGGKECFLRLYYGPGTL